MRTVIFSWEYPPRIVGKLAQYVNDLAVELSKGHVETYVVTYNDTFTGAVEEPNKIKVVRVDNPVRAHVNLITWDLTLNQEVERVAANIYYQAPGHMDVIDVIDWHFIPAAVTLKNALGIPFVYSVDSLEEHRAPNANAPFNMAIRGIEWLGFFEAKRITVKSEWMLNEVVRLYKVPTEKIEVIFPDTKSWVKNIRKVYNAVSGEAELV